MANMEFIQTEIPDVILVKPTVIEDHRGFFMESYHIEKFKIGGINCTFVQDNHVQSVQNTLRGLHFQVNFPQAKLFRCLKGKVFDVAVDLRKSSPYYGQWVGQELSEDNNGKKSIIFITDSAGKERIAYSYGSVIYSQLEEYLVDGLGKDFALACRVSWIVPKNGGKNYLKLDEV